jgi:sugar/nucleoside kinase (ribokinase family)
VPDGSIGGTVARTRIVAFGDVIDDVVAVPEGPIRDDTDTPSFVRFTAGGSPANTAAWLGSLGAEVDFVGMVNAADVGRHAALLPGVTAHLAGHPTLPTGAIVVIVEGEHRTMLTSRGANAAFDPASVTAGLLAGAAVMHFTGHALLNESGAAGIRAAIDRARAAGVAVSVSPGSAGFIADYGVEEFRAAIAGATIVFASIEEGRLLTGLEEPAAVAGELAKSFEVVVLTLGSAGVLVNGDLVAAVRVPVVDPTGAGDAFCAGFLDEWVRSRDSLAAARAGTEVASRAVGIIGARPA